MDTSARTVATSIAVLTAAILVVHTFSLLRSSTPASSKLSRKSKRQRGSDQLKVYVPGLVNTGNTCFFNSTLQAMAALPSLRLYLETRKELNGHDEDSITLALYETIELLNTLHRFPTSRTLTRLINTLKKKASHVLTSQQEDAQELFQILSSQLSEERDKVDNPTTSSLLDRAAIESMTAGELPHPHSRRQSVSSTMIGSSAMGSSWHMSSSTASLSGSTTTLALSSSTNALSVPSSPDGNSIAAMTASFILDQTEQTKYQRAKSPFMGLLASRVSCVDCGYTAAIRHSTFDNLSLTVPARYSCTIEECLEEFVHLDTIHDFNCRKCTVLNALKEVNQIIDNTQRRLLAMDSQSNGHTETASEDINSNGSNKPSPINSSSPSKDGASSGRRQSSGASKLDESRIQTNLVQALQWKSKIQECLQYNIEMDLAPIELTPVRSKRTTKHSMIAKPPQALCLHLNRSMITPTGMVAKNPCRVQVRRILDFTPFTTSGHLTTEPTRSMSQRMKIPRSTLPSCRTASLRDSNIIFSSLPTEQKLSPVSSFDIKEDRVRYRLEAVLVHLGSHNSGHFVTFRRVPEDRGKREQQQRRSGAEAPPLNASLCSSLSNVDERRGGLLDSALEKDIGVDDDDEDDDEAHLKERWWRISDEQIQLETWATVRQAEAYMLFYEKIAD